MNTFRVANFKKVTKILDHKEVTLEIVLLTALGFFSHVYEGFSCMYFCVICMFSAHGNQKRALDPLGLEFHMVVLHHVGAGSVWFSRRATSALNA